MAGGKTRSLTPKKNDGKAIRVTTPSPYGSHSSMLVNEKGNGLVELKDDRGTYITESWRLDNGQADPNRNAESRFSNESVQPAE